jgi:hypothetical protein
VEERLAGGESEYGISEEFEHLVIANEGTTGKRTAAQAQSLHLTRLRAVGKRLFKEFSSLEAMTQALFQRRNFP